MVRFQFRKRDNINIGRVVTKIAISLIALWVGGTVLTALGSVMINTSSPFYSGLSLIGWTVGNQITNGTAGRYFECDGTIPTSVNDTITTVTGNCITATNGAGILGVIGLIAIASIVMEFVQVRMG